MATPQIRRTPLNLLKRTSKKLSASQAYSRLYYDKKLKPTVDAKMSQYFAKNPQLRGNTGTALRYRNIVTQELLNADTDEVKAEVEKARDEGLFQRGEGSGEQDVGNGDDAVEEIERQRRMKAHSLHKQVLSLI